VRRSPASEGHVGNPDIVSDIINNAATAHQNNLLVMGPGGYRFGDYWRIGLPLEILIVVGAMFLLPWFWPFAAGPSP
jgi:hypothetical protein